MCPTRHLLLYLASTSLLIATTVPAQDDGPDEKTKAYIEGIQAGELPCPLDSLADIPATWSLTPDRLDALYAIPAGIENREKKGSPYFDWLTTTRERAHFIRHPYGGLALDMSFFGGELPVEEVIVDFLENGKLNGISVSVWNRADAEKISASEFERRMKLCGQHLSAQLGVRPVTRKANPTQGLLTEGWIWISGKGMAILDHNPEAMTGSPEFLRLRIAPRDATGTFAAAMRDRAAAVKLSDLPRNVVNDRNSGDTYIKGIPMVDQGPKGYCLVASCQRLLEYYGIPCDQHQIAQITGSDAERGVTTLAMSQSLEKIDYRFKTRFKRLMALAADGTLREDLRSKPSEQRDFEKHVAKYVDDGIPLLWSLTLGEFPEEPPNSKQANGGHMRMIIGYNSNARKIIFSDTWGAGHEIKYMKTDDAFQATTGLFVMTPTAH